MCVCVCVCVCVRERERERESESETVLPEGPLSVQLLGFRFSRFSHI